MTVCKCANAGEGKVQEEIIQKCYLPHHVMSYHLLLSVLDVYKFKLALGQWSIEYFKAMKKLFCEGTGNVSTVLNGLAGTICKSQVYSQSVNYS